MTDFSATKEMNIFRYLFTFLFFVGSSAAAPPESSSPSSSVPTVDWRVEFVDPTETFQTPPPTEIRLGELLAESDFVAVVRWTDSFNTVAL